jgi:hypothetical protein
MGAMGSRFTGDAGRSGGLVPDASAGSPTGSDLRPSERTSVSNPTTDLGGAPLLSPDPTQPIGASRPDPGPPGAGVQAVQQPGSGLGLIISAVVAALVLILGFYAAGDSNGSKLPIAQTTKPFFWVMAAVAVVTAIGGAIYADRIAAQAAAAVGRERPDGSLPTAWTVPAVATVAAILLVATYHNATMIVAGPLIAFLGNAGALFARDLLDDAGDSTQRAATTIHTLVIHAVAFLALGAVYLNKMGTPVLAILVGLIGGLLTLETLERGTASREIRLLYAALAGWAIAEAALGLNWWQTHGWTGGAILLVCFYLASGVLLARTQRSVLRTRDLVEFGLVSLAAFVILAVTA